jgi:hypothetical protein
MHTCTETYQLYTDNAASNRLIQKLNWLVAEWLRKNISLVHKDIAPPHRDISLVHREIARLHKDITRLHRDMYGLQ